MQIAQKKAKELEAIQPDNNTNDSGEPTMKRHRADSGVSTPCTQNPTLVIVYDE